MIAAIIFSEQLPFTAFLNRIFGHAAAGMAEKLGIHADPHAPIPNWIAMQVLVVLLLIGIFLLVRAKLSVDRPGAVQHTAEGVYGFVNNLGKELIGHHGYEPFVPYLIALGTFLLTSNLIGLVPFFESPTANPSVPLGCAISTFLYYNFHGFKHAGLGYLKHFAGPVVALAWLMFPIEVISHVARVMSLTVRLFANIFAGDMLTLAFFSLVPVLVPVVFLVLHVAVSFIQTYIFILLTTVYLSGAVGDEH